VSRLLCLCQPLAEDEEVYTLNIHNPERNPSGFFAIKTQAVKMPKELIDTLTVMLSVPDVRDYQQSKYSAKLLPGGEGIVITKPRQPLFLYCRSDDLAKFKHVIPGAEFAHKAAANKVCDKAANEQLKEVVLYFPDGMICNQKYFNDEDEPDSLEATFMVISTAIGTRADGKEVLQHCSYVRWDFVIDGEARVLNYKKKKSHHEEVAAAMLQGMASLNIHE
jgi:hypothetical protein